MTERFSGLPTRAAFSLVAFLMTNTGLLGMNKFNGLLITLVVFVSPAFAAMPMVENIQKKEATLSVQASSQSVNIDIAVICGVSNANCLSQFYDDNDGLFTVTVTPASDGVTATVALSVDPAVNPGNWQDGFIASNAESQSLRFKLVLEDGSEHDDQRSVEWFPYSKPGIGTWYAYTKGEQFINPGTYKITIIGGVWHQ